MSQQVRGIENNARCEERKPIGTAKTIFVTRTSALHPVFVPHLATALHLDDNPISHPSPAFTIHDSGEGPSIAMSGPRPRWQPGGMHQKSVARKKRTSHIAPRSTPPPRPPIVSRKTRFPRCHSTSLDWELSRARSIGQIILTRSGGGTTGPASARTNRKRTM